MVVRGYDREEVDAYIARLRHDLDIARDDHSPSGAVKRALDQVGDEVAGILQRAHETAGELTAGSKREADERIMEARRAAEQRLADANAEAAAITAQAEARLREIDIDTDRIWAERDRIVKDARQLARQLMELADTAADQFPPEDSLGEVVDAEPVDWFGDTGLNGSGTAPADEA
jgi:cell division septum initiation protein DivIVA